MRVSLGKGQGSAVREVTGLFAKRAKESERERERERERETECERMTRHESVGGRRRETFSVCERERE